MAHLQSQPYPRYFKLEQFLAQANEDGEKFNVMRSKVEALAIQSERWIEDENVCRALEILGTFPKLDTLHIFVEQAIEVGERPKEIEGSCLVHRFPKLKEFGVSAMALDHWIAEFRSTWNEIRYSDAGMDSKTFQSMGNEWMKIQWHKARQECWARWLQKLAEQRRMQRAYAVCTCDQADCVIKVESDQADCVMKVESDQADCVMKVESDQADCVMKVESDQADCVMKVD